MNKAAKNNEDYLGREFIITREFDAPRELVFRAWTEPALIAQWWGPKGFLNIVNQWEAKPGHPIHLVMRSPNGDAYPMGGEFREIIAPEKLVLTTGALDESGRLLFEFLHTLTFVERDEKTVLTLKSRVLNATPNAGRYISGFEDGMTQSLERLSENVSATGGPLIVERIFNAPADSVWRALTDKDAIKEWSFALPDFKPEVGFKYQFAVEHKGHTFEHLCEVKEVIPGKKLSHTWRYKGYEGDSLVTYELFPEGSQTRLRLTHEGLHTFPRTAEYARCNFMQGWSLITASLRAYVESDTSTREILISREFQALRSLVWQAMTDPKHIVHWWGPRGFSTTIEEMDVRPGGVWKHVMQGPDGTKYPNHSVFKEIVPEERIVFSHGGYKEDGPGVRFMATWSFEAIKADQTKVTIRMVFPTSEARDFVVKEFGAIEGGRQTLERMGEHLKTM